MPLVVRTARIGFRSADAFDVTRKSGGDVGRVFAPSWDILMREKVAEKAGEDMEARWPAYAEAYTEEMRASYGANRASWRALLARPSVVLLCYCTNPERCHRTVLARDILPKLGATYEGEAEQHLRTREDMEGHHCHVRGCKRKCPPEKLTCAPHWKMLPVELGREVYRHYRPGQCEDMNPSEAWHRAADKALKWLAENDHAIAAALENQRKQGRLL